MGVKFKDWGLQPREWTLGHRRIMQSKRYIRLIIPYFIILITKSSRPTMSLVHIVPAFTDLFTSKRITFQALRPLILSKPRGKRNTNLRQQICLVSSFAYFLHQALQHELFLAEKLKHEVFYSVLQYQPALRNKSGALTKKHHHDRKVVRVRKADITINEILEQAVYDGLALSKSPQSSLVVERDSNKPSDNNLVTLPPFDANTIAELTQNITQPSELPLEQSMWEPNKLESYQRWLALTQRGIDISNVPTRIPKTKKKNATKLEVGPDHKIIVSQGELNASVLEKLATKAKSSKNPSNILNKSFFACLDAMHEKLSDSDRLIFLLKKKEKSFVKKPTFIAFEGNFAREMIDSPERAMMSSKDKSISPSVEAKDMFDQRVVSKTLETIFIKTATTSFVELCKKCPNVNKADVFHELLHLSFPIQQLDPAGFGEIKISRK